MVFPDWIFQTKQALGPWLTGLMADGEPFGRFQHAADCLVGPNLVTSSYVVGLQHNMNLFELTSVQRTDWAHWFASMQDMQTGQFIDPELERHLPQISRHGRDALWNHRRFATKQGQASMLQLGVKPLMQLDISQLGFDPNEQSIQEHLQTFDWDQNPWAGGSAAAASLAMMDLMVRDGQTQWVPVIQQGIECLESQQDIATGLWGAEKCHHRLRINATLKVITRLFSTFRRPLMYSEKLIDSVLKNWADTAYFHPGNPELNACDDMNTLVIAAYALRFTDHRREEVMHHAMQRIDWLKIYRRSDGIFSLTPEGSILKLNDIPITLGQDQGDVHGVNLICNALALIADILDAQDELGWRFHGFHYSDWLLTAGSYMPTWDVTDLDTYQPCAIKD